MELKINRETIVCPVQILNADVSQPAEQDFILPDYCADIFRVLKCCMLPCIVSAGINGSKLTFDVSVTVRVLYKSSDSNDIHTVEQNLNFTKSIDLPQNTNDPLLNIIPHTGYVNCRVINQRRLEVKGSINFRVNVTDRKEYNIVSDAFGCGIQLKKSPTVFPAKRVCCSKMITVIEELELSAGKPELGRVLRNNVKITKGEQKILPGKLITKGEAEIELLYLAKDITGKPPEKMRFTIPFSQVIDIEGIEDDFSCSVDMTPSKCVINTKQDEQGILECELMLIVNAEAIKYETAELVNDAYSTKYECEYADFTENIMLEANERNKSISLQISVGCTEGEVNEVYDLWTEDVTSAVRYDEQNESMIIYGKAVFCMLGRLNDGTAAYSEKECIFEQPVDIDEKELSSVEAEVRSYISGCSYTLSDDGTIQAKAQLENTIMIKRSINENLFTDIAVNKQKPKECDRRCAVKICYTDSKDSLWSIAKKYSTSAQAIAEENPEDDSGRRALIIPIKN